MEEFVKVSTETILILLTANEKSKYIISLFTGYSKEEPVKNGVHTTF